MKVQCNQCGKMFKVADSQAHRSIKCLCKNIFLAVPLPEEIIEGEPEASVEREKPSNTFQQSASFDPNHDVPMSTDETEEGLNEFVSFLKNSRAQALSKDESPPPKMKSPDLPSFDLAEPLEEKILEEDIQVLEELPPAKSSSTQLSPSLQRDATLSRPARTESPAPFSNSKPPQRNSNSRTQHKHKRAITLAIAGIVCIVLVSIAAYWPQKPIEETVDPYLTQLLTPQKPTPGRKIQIAPQPETKIFVKPHTFDGENSENEIETIEPLLGNQGTSLFKKMKQELIAGEYENVVRLGSSTAHLEDEEAALFLEALFERAGKKAERHQELLKKLEEQRSARPNSSALIRTLAFAMIKDPAGERSIPKSIEILKSLQLTRSEDPLVFAYMGRAYERLDRMDLAHRAWDQALSLEPQFVWIFQIRDQLYRSEKKFNQALEMADKLSKVAGHEIDGYRRMGEIYELKNDENSAIHYYRKALKLSDTAELHLIIGDLLLEANQEGALREFEAGLRAHPSRTEKRDIYIRIARNQCGQQNYEAAAQAFKKAFAEDAHSVKIATEKARCELSAKSYRSAGFTLENALKLSPNNPQLWHDYGFALLHQDKLKPAVAAAKRALEIRPSDQNYYLMAQILIAMKKKPEAAVNLKRALQMNPKNREAKALLRSIN